MDFDPAEKGKTGQIFFRPHDDNPVDKIITETYEGWLKIICEKLENRQYEIKDGEITFENFTFYE
jgi:hypothetical protein